MLLHYEAFQAEGARVTYKEFDFGHLDFTFAVSLLGTKGALCSMVQRFFVARPEFSCLASPSVACLLCSGSAAMVLMQLW